MQAQAIAKNVRVSPQKVRLVIDQIKKMRPVYALRILDQTPKSASDVIKKVVSSALANAKNNLGLAEDTLVFKEVTVSKGQVFKRYRAVSRGRAHPILKRTSHIRVVLEGEQKKETATTENTEKSTKDTESKSVKSDNNSVQSRKLK